MAGDFQPIESDYLRPVRKHAAAGTVSIDLNADVGEGSPMDTRLMVYMSSISVACGGHAGDVNSMRRVLNAGMQSALGLGAHPGYADPDNKGRKSLKLSAARLKDMLREQLVLFRQVLATLGGRWQHVKLHGALYHDAARKRTVAKAVLEVLEQQCPGLFLYCQPLGHLYEMAPAAGFKVIPEYFADRGYQADGSLIPRGEPGDLIADPQQVMANVERLTRAYYEELRRQGLDVDRVARPATRNKPAYSLAMFAEDEPVADREPGLPYHPTFCLHGDSPNVLELARWLRIGLSRAHIDVTGYASD